MSKLYSTVATNQTTGWHPEPTFRGTFSILSTCLITMALCIWTAVHLNIPEPGQSGFFTRQLQRRLLWLVMGLLAPEIVRSHPATK
ncbi:hypothetical protein CC80DRAFT_398555 [Byssothecium circinans]|uniref:Uncharacterized protein n=1 Tax=Byssothecium circinans TaxID=147558 RepID=A0A6A5UGT0_9PLEO|nr:hypothetical protein CC80DRAFT_398555 [Byssothecium circinans]